MTNPIKKFLKQKLKFVRGTRFISFCFIACSVIIAAGILFAANLYYNIDTGEVVMEEIQRVTNTIRATGGLIVGGTASQNPASGYVFEVVGKTRLATTTVATGPLELTAADQELKFTGGTSYYLGFKAPTTVTSTNAYILPQHGTNPPSSDYVLTWQTGNQLQWKTIGGAGGGDVNTVGDCPGPECFVTDGAGNTLWFEGATPNAYEIALTAADPGADYTITLPAANGYVALGSSTANYVTYWSGTNTLTGEQYLSNTRGGTGANSSGWNGTVKVVGGSWSAYQGTANYAAYWSDANTIAAEQYLSVSRGGTGKGSWTQWGVLYADGTTSLTNTAAGATDYLLVGAGANAPTWKYIGQLLTAGTNIALSGTTNVTIATVPNPAFSVSVTSPLFTGTSTVTYTSAATTTISSTGSNNDIVLDPASGKITLGSGDYIRTSTGYEIGKSGTQVLIGMVPIMGFDLPIQCNTACTNQYATTTRIVENDPFPAASSGTVRRHKFVIRYADATTTANTTWQVATSSDPSSIQFTVPASESANLADGNVYITGNVTLPDMATYDWFLRVREGNNGGYDLKVYQIFLAGYDEIS